MKDFIPTTKREGFDLLCWTNGDPTVLNLKQIIAVQEVWKLDEKP